MTIVDMRVFFPWTWLIHLVRAFVAFNIAHAVLKNKYNTLVTFLSIILPCMLYSYCMLSSSVIPENRANEWFIVIGYYAALFVVLIFATTGNIFAKLFTTVFALIAYLCGSISYNLLVSICIDRSIIVRQGLASEVPLAEFMACSLFIFASSFIFVFFIKFVKTKTKRSFFYRSKLSFLFLFPATHILSVMVVTYAPLLASEDMSSPFLPAETYVAAFSIICMLLDCLIIFLVDYIEKIEQENIEKERELVKNKLDYQQMVMLKKEKREFRKVKHDFANILSTTKGFIEIGCPEKALDLLQSTNNDLMELAGFPVCSNETINTILFIKHQQAENHKIPFVSEISENYAVQVDDYDLCRLLNNIIDNALNAVYPLRGNPICKISIDIDADRIIIQSENTFEDSQPPRSKKSGEHGNGIGIIKEIARKYGGNYTVRRMDGVWYTETVLENKKLLSTPPNFEMKCHV